MSTRIDAWLWAVRVYKSRTLATAACRAGHVRINGEKAKASTTVVELALWGVATVMVQLLIFRVVDLVLHGLPKRIQDGEMAAAAMLVGAKLATAMILAAAVAG